MSKLFVFSRLRRLARSDRGASAVEFAIILAVLLLILFGTVEFGMAFHRKQAVEAAAREGARLASVGGSYNEIRARVIDAAGSNLFQDADIEVVTSPTSSGGDGPCNSLNQVVNVEVTIDPNNAYGVQIPLWGNVNLTYRSSAAFRCETVS